MAFLAAAVIAVGVFVLGTALVCRTDEEIVFTVRFTGLLLVAAVGLFLAVGVASIAADSLGLIYVAAAR